MYLLNRKIELNKKDDEIRIYLIGDVHIGSLCADIGGYKIAMKTLEQDKNGYGIFMGDMCDVIIPTDRRFNLEELDDAMKLLSQQYEFLEGTLETIKDKIILYHSGNHGTKFMMQTAWNEDRRICTRLDCNYGGDTSVTNLVLSYKGKLLKKWVIHSSHGYGGGYEIGATANRISKEERIVRNVSCHLMGHSHKLFSFIDCVGLESENNHLISRYAWFINTGSFLRAYPEGISSYAERKHYKPNPLGYAILHLTKDKIWNSSIIVDKYERW